MLNIGRLSQARFLSHNLKSRTLFHSDSSNLLPYAQEVHKKEKPSHLNKKQTLPNKTKKPSTIQHYTRKDRQNTFSIVHGGGGLLMRARKLKPTFI
jgi:hypothetical protein